MSTGVAEGPGGAEIRAGAGRWELLRALGALSVVAPPVPDGVLGPLGLPGWSRAEHTRLFVLDLPPYASVHLGPEGMLGGEGADRIAGTWRTLGLTPPSDADHLGTLLALYSELGEASGACRTGKARRRLDHARAAVLWEHLWSWVPGYLAAVSCHDRSARPWARLVGAALTREARSSAGAALLPLALRAAPGPIDPDGSLDDVLDALTVPVRTGFILTQSDIAGAAGRLGTGLRRGERRFALAAMLGQDPPGTLTWLAGHAQGWTERHRQSPPVPSDPGPWWADRAQRSAVVLRELAGQAGQAGGAGDPGSVRCRPLLL